MSFLSPQEIVDLVNGQQPNSGGNQYTGKIPDNYKPPEPVLNGDITMNTFHYVFSPDGATINGTPLNGLKLGQINGELYYYENGTWAKLQGSQMQRVLEQSVKDAKLIPPNNPIIQNNPQLVPNNPQPNIPEIPQIIPNGINQIEQTVPVDRPIDTSQLTMQKFPYHQSLFENPIMVVGLFLVGFGVFNMMNKK